MIITNAMTPTQQSQAAALFVEHWTGKGYEKGESQIFWTTLLNQVFGIEHPEQFITFEQQVHLDHTSFIDGFIPSTKVMIEQKSLGKNLAEGIKQSDGSVLNPFQQAKRYAAELPYSQRPRWIVTCNFAEFWVYDMEQPNGEPQKILLVDLEKEYYRLRFLVDAGNEHLKREMEVSFKAGKLVGEIYDLLQKQYFDADNPETLRSLNVLCVRLVFCLYAEDALLFGSKTAFHDYLTQYQAKDIRRALIDLFAVLDTPVEERDPYIDDVLKAFPYVNGGLFSNDTRLIIPQFTDELKELILAKASDDFDWSEISPTIFGAVFESTLNPDTRRSGGMHYTSLENIHKVIDPLFLNALKEEFATIKQSLPAPKLIYDKTKVKNVYNLPLSAKQRLLAFQDKLASLTFFDPACGSGNFLTESYISLRRLENEILRVLYLDQSIIGTFDNPVKVNIHQFYGIEINDFAVSVATTALWISEQQMLQETEKIASFNIQPLPLKPYHNIHEGNALRIDWSSLFMNPPSLADQPSRFPNYIMGNPPFVGGMMMSRDQKQEMLDTFGAKLKGVGELDYVGAWYKKSALLMEQSPAIKAALVSTNSITQGEQVAILWQPLMKDHNIHIDFAFRTFRWDSEADIKAHVHCVIIGFSAKSSALDGIPSSKKIYLSDNQFVDASNINGYLADAPDVFIVNRSTPLCDAPAMNFGNMPRDGGGFILSEEEKDELIAKEPLAAKWIHLFLGAVEFINNKKRYCLWLQGASPAEIRQCPTVMQRIAVVRDMRLASAAASTRKMAETPTLFAQITQPVGVSYILVPRVSSERRRYVPIGFVDGNVIASDAVQIIPNASLYHFGILTSNVHMAWMRIVCGRLEMRYRYSKDIVYNNFPWPTPTDEQKARIEQTAQAILDARAKYPDCSLADLYDEVTMPPELRRAHQDNDRAVMAAYGFSPGKTTESECVAELFKMYRDLTK